METKFEKLEKVLSELNISESELENWFNNRNQNSKDKVNVSSKNIANFIPTELPLVYRRGNELTVENGLNLSRKDELWGIQLLSGVMVALKCGPGYNVSELTWREVKEFAEKMRLNGKPGHLPSKNALKKHWNKEEREKFLATIRVLEKNDIGAYNYWGYIWCSEEFIFCFAYYFDLIYGKYDWDFKSSNLYLFRVALAFG